MTEQLETAEPSAPTVKPKKPLTIRKALRLAGILLALALIGGELFRSWGAGRHFFYIFDDIWMGLLLLAGAVMFGRDTLHRRALFAGGWGAVAGMTYGSFVSKLVDPQNTIAGNFSLGILTALIGIAFGVSIIGLIVTLLLPGKGKG